MKKILSLFMALVMLFSITATAFATNTEETYYTVPVQYSDNIGHHEGLRVMVQNDAVYVHAQMFAERLGYTFGETSDGLVIYNKDKTNGLPFGVTQFKYNSTQVSHMLFNAMVDTYEAPFAPIKNSEGSWIPLEYAALLLNSSAIIGKDALLIDIPTKKIIDYFLDIARNSGKYNFDWADDFGYTETDITVLGASSHLVNIFSGLLEFDGPSWATLFQQFAGSTTLYDKKYSEDIAILICTESDDELEAATEDIELMCDLLDVDSDLGKLLSFTDEMLDFEVGTLQKQCEAALAGLKAGNSTAVSYNRAYQALETAVDRQTSFLYTGGEFLEVQKRMADATGNLFSVLDWCTKLAEIGGYALEFYNQDKFSWGALQYYLTTAGNGLELPNAMKSSMVSYCNALSGTLKGYGVKRFWDNLDEWVTDAVTDKVLLHSIVGSQAAAALIAWNIASNTIPFLKDGLSGADNFELAIYSMVFQADTYLNYLSERDVVFAEDIAQENLYHLAQYCYLYLKSCYITREAALASLASKSSSTQEKIQPLVDYQNSINAEIARMLVKLKQATETTTEKQQTSVFGFLPSNNKQYLDEYDGSKLVLWVTEFGESTSIVLDNLVTDAYSEEFGGRKFHIPKINLDGDAVADINTEIWTTLYDGVVVDILEWWNKEHYEGDEYITYDWYINNTVLSLVIESLPVEWAWWDYYVYNVDITSRKEISRDSLLTLYGLSLDEYYELAKQVLGSRFWSGWDRTNENFQSSNFVSWFNEALRKTISRENIEKSIPYINGEGDLCILAPIYSLAGADYYWNNLNMIDFILIPDYANLVEPIVHTINISKDDAYRIACEYWGYSPEDVSGETGVVFVVGGEIQEVPNTGKSYYRYMLRCLVVGDDDSSSGSQMSTCDWIFIDAETGECVTTIS